MTETVEPNRGSADILAIGQLALHRETVRELGRSGHTGQAERARPNGNGRRTRGNCIANSGGIATGGCASAF